MEQQVQGRLNDKKAIFRMHVQQSTSENLGALLVLDTLDKLKKTL